MIRGTGNATTHKEHLLNIQTHHSIIHANHLMRQRPCAPVTGSRSPGQVVSECPVPPSGGASDGRHRVVSRSVAAAPSLGTRKIETTTSSQGDKVEH